MTNPLRHALILCNGQPPSRALAARLARMADYCVAADGGANAARALGIHLNAIVGDLDSITRATRRHYASSLILRIRRQDNTDLEKALDFVLAQGVRKVTLTGLSGRRTDFTLANLSVLWRYAGKVELVIESDEWTAYPVRSRFVGKARRGATVSIIPFGPCGGITLKGLAYPLRNARLRVGDVGVSNVVLRSPFSVTLRRGHLLVLVLKSGRGKGQRR